MELKYFRLIKTIAEEGNIANSSEQLFLTQSALSHQLRQLEDRLGTQAVDNIVIDAKQDIIAYVKQVKDQN